MVSVALDVQNGDVMRDFKSVHIDKLRFGSRIIDRQGYKILVLSGNLDAYTASKFRKAVMSILGWTEKNLIIDMHNVRYMDGMGLSTLLSAMKRLNPNGGAVMLVGCNPHLQHLLTITRMSAIFSLHQNMDDAIQSISLQVSL